MHVLDDSYIAMQLMLECLSWKVKAIAKHEVLAIYELACHVMLCSGTQYRSRNIYRGTQWL